ncbi:hypothetical protein [Nocardia sp. NBC_00511]|uniref:hypothetical protein n=1 Tax=Nocardia sp. NBC_00511 TaxID=2903591 RepID=UPI0030DE9BB7
MRRVVIGLAAIASVATMAGSTPVGQSLSAPVTSMDELRGLFTRAASSQRTWTVVWTDSGIDSDGLSCKVQVNPIKASDCAFEGHSNIAGTRTITFPDIQYLTGPMSPHGDERWFSYAAQDNPELKNSFEYAWADLDTDFYFLPGVATIGATHPDRIEGRDTTRYDLDIDIRAPRALPSDLSDRAGENITETVQIWVGARNLPVRVVIRTTSDHSLDDTTTTITYSNWRQSLDIQAPPADKVVPGEH